MHDLSAAFVTTTLLVSALPAGDPPTPVDGDRLAPGVSIRFRTSQTSLAHAVAIGNEFAYIASGSPAELVAVDLANGRSESLVGGRWIRSLALSADGSLLAAGRSGGTIDVLDANRLTVSNTLPGRGKVNGLAFSPNGRRLVSSHQSGRLLQWEVATGRQTARRGLPDVGWKCRFSPDGTRVLVSIEGRRVGLWNPAEDRFRLVAGDATKAQAAWLTNARIVRPSTTARGLVVQWLEDDHTAARWTDPGSECRALVPYRSERFVLAGDAAGAVRLWDLATGRFVELGRVPNRTASELAVSPDGRHLVVGGAALRGTTSNAVVWRLPEPLRQRPAEYVRRHGQGPAARR